MNETIILCVAFGKRYVQQQVRLKQTIEAVCPNVHIKFWTDELPKGSKPWNESLYGFKVHAVKWALDNGYKKIIWMDTACIVLQSLDYYYTLELPVVAARDDNKLKNHIGDKAKKWYNKPEIPDSWHLVGGSLYVFDFNHPDCIDIFNQWSIAETGGVFGSQKEQSSGEINKHRHDESCMAVALYTNGYEPVGCDIACYNQGEGSVIIKQHFK